MGANKIWKKEEWVESEVGGEDEWRGWIEEVGSWQCEGSEGYGVEGEGGGGGGGVFFFFQAEDGIRDC